MKLKGIEIRNFNVYRLADSVTERSFLKPPFTGKELKFKIVGVDNLENIVLSRGEGTYNRFRGYFEEGEQGYYVYYKNNVVACGWLFLNLGSNDIKKKYIVIPKGFVWLHDFWTHPNFRGKGIYPTLLQMICRDVISKNLVSSPHNILIDTDRGNIASNKGIIKANFELIGNIVAMRIYKSWIILRKDYETKVSD